MFCENCEKKEATVHLTEIIKNVKSEYHLCEICAKNIKLNLKLRDYSDSLQEILTFLDEDKTDAGSNWCLNCGLSLAEIKKQNKPGCPYCLHYLGESIISIIPYSAEGKKHIGKKPLNFVDIEKDNEIHHLLSLYKEEPEPKISTDELKEKLEIAVSEERYEDAAILRDLVRELERVG